MSVIKITESRTKNFLIFNEKGDLLGETNNLLSALAFARGVIEKDLKQNPFESNAAFFDTVIINLSLSTAVNLMNGIRETSIMASSDYSAIIDAYKQGHLIQK